MRYVDCIRYNSTKLDKADIKNICLFFVCCDSISVVTYAMEANNENFETVWNNFTGFSYWRTSELLYSSSYTCKYLWNSNNVYMPCNRNNTS